MGVISTRRLAAIALCFAVFPVSADAAPAGRSWAQAQIKLVIKRGIFAGTPATFRPQDPLTQSSLAHVVAQLTGNPEEGVSDPTAPVSIETLDATLVRALGLGDTAHLFYLGARNTGIQPPSRFGTEAVARLLGLRLNHPVGQDNLELQPEDTATRAEAAYSAAQILGFKGNSGFSYGSDPQTSSVTGNAGAQSWSAVEDPSHGHQWDRDGSRYASSATAPTDFAATWQVESVKIAAQSFALPVITDWQRRVLGTAISYTGYPYIWGGTGEDTLGFDCSGFVWRVYKLTSYPGENDLAGVLRGRTTMEMSGEVPVGQRIGFNHLEPGDVLFFGVGPRSKPAQIDHTGIYLGNGWFINSSDYGVAVASLDGWHRMSFAWARRPLHEAGLE